MTEKDRIDDLYDIAVLDRALYREEFRRQVESHQPPIREPESECNCKGGRHCEVCRKADSGGAGIEKLELDLIHLGWHDVHKYKKIEKMPNGRLEEIDDLKICLLGMEEQFNKNFKKIADRINKQ